MLAGAGLQHRLDGAQVIRLSVPAVQGAGAVDDKASRAAGLVLVPIAAYRAVAVQKSADARRILQPPALGGQLMLLRIAPRLVRPVPSLRERWTVKYFTDERRRSPQASRDAVPLDLDGRTSELSQRSLTPPRCSSTTCAGADGAP